MKRRCILVSSVLLTVVQMSQVRACAPDFPLSYFPHDYGCDCGYPLAMAVTTNAAVKCFDAYRVTPHLGTELAMIGAHYYSAWTGKAPRGNRVSTARADELDFFSAGEAAAVSREAVEEDWRRFIKFREGVCKRLEDGEEVEVPQGIPGYALEFYLYKLGHAQWLVFRKDEDPAPFGELLALPKERRLYRTVWVHFVRIANARKFADKDQHVDALRQAVDAGFKDTAALESFTLRFLSNTCGRRYDPLVLTAYAHAAWEEWPGFAKRIFCRRRLREASEKGWLEALCVDPVGVEVAIAYGAGGNLPAGAVCPEKPVLGADRQAWIAFNRGDLVLCRKLLAMAPGRSLVRLFLEARLARLDGDYGLAAERLHEWLEEYRQKGRQPREILTGYGIYPVDGGYWDTGMRQDGEYGFRGGIRYSGRYGPSGNFHENLLGRFRDYAVQQSHEPTLSRVVSGELGVVKVATRDLEEALYAFLLARNWIDAAFVAERCMTVDELVAFMCGNRIEPCDMERFRGLLMRRLMRCGRVEEALIWAPKDVKPLCVEFHALAAVAQDLKADADARAVAYLNLSRLTATRGMELMGTELRPDVAIYRGRYSADAHPLEEPVELLPRLGMNQKDSRWGGWAIPEDRVTGRFHYRRKAVGYAREAVGLAKDVDVRAWALMFGGVAALSLDDAKEADWFYKRLASMHHPQAHVAGWFNSSAYNWFKDAYYDKERHAVPLRVPPRLTKEQLRLLKAPKP